MSAKKPLVVFIVGPTATGKSEMGLEAAKALGGEILNTDSIQVYETVEVGTAKPPQSYFDQVPHHLFGFVREGETCTAGDYRKAALSKISQRNVGAGGIFYAVGGSGFYVQALEKGMYPVPDVPSSVKKQIELDLKAQGREALFEELKVRDPEYAAGISANDTYRIMRALEINRHLQTAGAYRGITTWTGIRKDFEANLEVNRPFDVLKLGVIRPRDEIRSSVARRTSLMLANGWIEEVESLRARGFGAWAPLLSVGYKEVGECLDGTLKKDDLAQAITTSTMQLVKRQTTWFRKDPIIQWFDPKAGWSQPIKIIEEALRARS